MALKKVQCKTCGADCAWLIHPKNKKYILVDWETISDQEATVYDRDTMTTHWATCPDAEKWRNKKKQQ